MAEQIRLPRLDACPVEYEDFHNVMARWLTDLVDQLNAALQQLDNGLAIMTTGNVANGTNTINIPVTGMSTLSFVTASIDTSTVPVTIVSATPNNGFFTIVLSGDPGASITINYSALVAT